MKPWSISTTVRNPERIRDFLWVLQKMNGEVWNKENQKKFQIMLIQYKKYGAGEKQFYKDLTPKEIALMEIPESILYEQAEKILNAKNYEGGGDMRGRQSFNPLEKMGLAYLDKDKKIVISDFGKYFLKEDYDLGETFFRSFLKWQIPNPDARDYKAEDGYNIKPFIATLHLINEVNKICEKNNQKPKGISKTEFQLFALTLFDYKEINNQAKKLFQFRTNYEKLKSEKDKTNFVNKLQQTELHFTAQQIEEIEKYIFELKNIYKSKGKKPIELERLCTLALNALNDAISINPNYPVGDDNEPTFTAPANKPDIECFYKNFNAICEVTMLTNRQQWYAEGQPVMRHLRDFENLHSKETFCIFIAPDLHRDTVNTYWTSVKYEYEGVKQKIIPLTIIQFVKLLDALIIRKKKGSQIFHNEIKDLFDKIIDKTNSVSNSDKWLETIPEEINNWILKLAA